MMSMNRRAAIIGTIATLLALAAVMTAGLASLAQANDRILTPTTVEKFCESYPDVQAVAAKRAAETGQTVAGATDKLSAVLKAASDAAVAADVEGVVQRHGFSSTQEWAEIGRSIARAYAHIKTGGVQSKASGKVDKAVRKIEENDFLNDKQKAKLIKALRKSVSEFTEEPPAENVAAVRPMMSEIEAVVR